MSDRFDFLEIGDPKPPAPTAPDSRERAAGDTGWRPPPRLHVVELIGEQGTEAGQFQAPLGLAVDPWGALYVADSNNHRVQRITSNAKVFVYGRPGNQAGQLWGPHSVAVHPGGEFFYVVEQGNNRVQCFRYDSWQSHGMIGGLKMPSGIAFDSEGMLWIADTGNSRVLRFNIQTGKFIGGLDQSVGIVRPISVACDRTDKLYVVDGVTNDITCYSLSGSRIRALNEIRRLASPRQIVVDAQGGIYVTEAEANRLQVYAPNGDCIFVFDNPGPKLGALRSPSGVAIGPRNEIYCADTLNHRILRLEWQ